jgi:hypothetical protein
VFYGTPQPPASGAKRRAAVHAFPRRRKVFPCLAAQLDDGVLGERERPEVDTHNLIVETGNPEPIVIFTLVT